MKKEILSLKSMLDQIKLYIAVCVLFLTSGCGVSNNNYAVEDFNSYKHTMLPISYMPFSAYIANLITQDLSQEDANHYNNNVQDLLEKHSDRTKRSFYSDNKNFVVTFHIDNSFKIQSTGEYCRQYTQQINYKKEIIDNIGIACRSDNGTWQAIKLTN